MRKYRDWRRETLDLGAPPLAEDVTPLPPRRRTWSPGRAVAGVVSVGALLLLGLGAGIVVGRQSPSVTPAGVDRSTSVPTDAASPSLSATASTESQDGVTPNPGGAVSPGGPASHVGKAGHPAPPVGGPGPMACGPMQNC